MQTDTRTNMSYVRFFAMVATSTIVMFALMYVNSFEVLGHARLSAQRIYMGVIMGAAMMIVMLGFMFSMYKNRTANIAIIAGAAVLLVSTVLLMRNQAMIGDVAYMNGMIPHHSIAILTSENARIEDVRVRELADAIIDAQQREIGEMEWLVEDIRANGLATTDQEAAARPVPGEGPPGLQPSGSEQ